VGLPAQIELITVPQEFTRLCNAVLRAEHGEDFLPIDDDRADRGNDGYLKSQKRMFAAHCFKRVQNQRLDDAIRRKMVGDLGKAILLDEEEIWDVDAWTFLCNYPISEDIGATVLRIGTDAGIDVAWEGPHFLADGLQRHPEIRDQFPDLQVNEITERLVQIQEALTSGQEEAPPPAPPAHVPRTALEQKDLLAARPDGWEFLLFASVLLRGKERLERKWHDHRLPPFSLERTQVGLLESSRLFGSHFQGMLGLIEAMNLVFSKDEQLQAFGAPGESGDPLRIEQFGERVVEAYEGMLDLTASLRGADVPEPFQKVHQVAMRVADRPLEEIRGFIDDVVNETERVPAFAADTDPDKEPLEIRVILTLTVDDGVIAEYERELEIAERNVLESS
jgi:hypothetical protein